MIRFSEMRVETPYNLADVIDRGVKPGHPTESQCTYCGVTQNDRWYPIAEISVYRVWTGTGGSRASTYEPGSVWQWRCPDHPKRAWAPHSHEAPDDLLPLERHSCEEVDRLTRTKCGVTDSTVKFVEGWFCSQHRYPYELEEKRRRLVSDEDPEAGERSL